ncbi:ABC transporter ATP-binding protein [Paracoccus aestuariivivens]|uniref:sn-glycerol-3-phosphate ABC transporter ATP-binding protein UgpC n=1 Tax=Paracoccus aestuariivivens TaxID=1820333 RepID=A0A6L6J7K4_9RHOB|nr:sn-glycerol-3-phosphate ABC transporter ATP-binding protein UgpC [Paracoccus aestuariivivens]MTH78092.1 sn-glycerol-3-phosphate ABC transporter ATP-binding protein UgpC [Paracoccus aestuariivivens]
MKDNKLVTTETSLAIKGLQLSFGAIQVLKDVNIEIGQGEFIVLLGGSGSGKSTILNCIAGLLDITDGQIFINGKNVTWKEPKDRGIGMVFQSYALYPQMSVRGNLAFGLKNARMPKDEIARRIKRAAEILQIEDYLDRKPAALSGGQRQRVAIGRALVRDVDVFLFDEPLSNLDAKLRAELRVEIKRLHDRLGNTMVYVTHDQIEAMTLADRIALLRHGVIQQFASPAEIYSKPVNIYVAGFIGSPSMNFINGQITGREFAFNAHKVNLAGYDGHLRDGPAILGVRPEHTGFRTDGPGIDATVEMQEHMGAESVLHLRLDGQRFTLRTPDDTHYPEGTRLRLTLDISRASLFDPQSELRL